MRMYVCVCLHWRARTFMSVRVCVSVDGFSTGLQLKLWNCSVQNYLLDCCKCVCVPSTHRFIAKCYCLSWRLHSLFPHYQLLSHFLSHCLFLHLIFISISPSTVCFHTPSPFTTYNSAILILCFSWEASESKTGLNIGVNGLILHFDTPHIISPSI